MCIHAPTIHSYISDEDRYLARLKHIEDQARGIHGMTKEDTDCVDLLTQIRTSAAVLEDVAFGLLDDHFKYCVAHAAQAGGAAAERKISEASAATARLAKS